MASPPSGSVAATPPQSTAAASVAPSAPQPSHESLVTERCATLAEMHRNALLAYPASSGFHDAGASRDEGDRDLDVEGLGACSEVDGGVWGIVAAPPHDAPAEGALYLAVVYIPLERAAGAATSVTDTLGFISPGTTENPQLGASAFDYDGDHLPELFVSIDRRDDREEGGPCIPYADRHESWVFSVKRAGSAPSLTLAPMQPSPGVTVLTVTDADRDGRPDFVVADPYTLGPSVCTFDDAPGWLAHSLADGSFSRSDVVAQRYARDACINAEEPSLALSLNSVACARVHGATREEVERQLQQRCGARRARRDPACAVVPELLRAAAVTPPWVLSH